MEDKQGITKGWRKNKPCSKTQFHCALSPEVSSEYLENFANTRFTHTELEILIFK